MVDFEKELKGINILELGPEKYLRALCELGLRFCPNGPSELGMAFQFKESLCGRVAGVIGINTDTKFQGQDFQHFIESLDAGLPVDVIAENFTAVVGVPS